MADQILEYNDVDLRQATAEQAAYELPMPNLQMRSAMAQTTNYSSERRSEIRI